MARLAISGGLAAALLGATALTLASGGPAPPPAARPPTDERPAGSGQALFLAKGCNGCHTLAGLPGAMRIGPDLSGLRGVAGYRRPGMAAEAYVRESILAPQAYVVPGFGEPPMPRLPVSGAEVDALVAFLLGGRE